MPERSIIAYLLLLAMVVALAAGFAVYRAHKLEERAVLHGRRREDARRKYRWWNRR